MVNNTDNSKLYEVVKQTLSNYEAPYNATDWEQMKNLLDLAPKSKSFKFKRALLSIFGSLKAIPKSRTFKWVFSLYMFIGLAIVGGAYLLYSILSSPKKPDTTISTPQQKIENTNTNTKTPVMPSNTIIRDVPKVDGKIPEPLNTTDKILPTSKEDLAKPDESPLSKKENNLIEKTEIKKTTNADSSSKNDLNIQQILKKGTEPVNADTRDTSKGIIGQLKENVQTVKEPKKRRDNITSDSITKYLNQQPQDSLKGPR